MSDDSGVQFVGARSRKVRPHSQMSETSSTTPGPSSRPQVGQSSSSNPHPQRLQLPTRYPGDGFDFRRPVMSSPSTGAVIDLTNEPDSSPRQAERQPRPGSTARHHARLPRFGREIMADVVDLEEEDEDDEDDDDEDEEEVEEVERIHIPNRRELPSSPEVEFVGSTTRPPDPTPPPPPPSFGTSTSAHLWQWLRGHPRFGGHTLSGGLAFGRQLPWPRHFFGPPPQEDTLWIGDDAEGGVDLTLDLDVDLQSSAPRPAPPVDTYKPPTPPPEGFTRNAREDDVVVCPNCDEELGMGDETKQQIWVVKNCGHVYCGECARNRSLSKAKKTQRVKPFSKCQAVDCDKPVSAPRAMFQIYL